MARVREGEADWHAFTELPGTRASWRAAEGHKQLTSRDGQVLATLWPRIELTVEGRSYEMRRNEKRITRFRCLAIWLMPRRGSKC